MIVRWDPNREHEVFFNQSVTLYTTYYHLQILIHRPFIALPRKPSRLSFPSLAICTNAARSCSHIVDIQQRRFASRTPFNQVGLLVTIVGCTEASDMCIVSQMSVFTAGIVLLLNIWGGKRSGLSTDPNKEMADVHKCMQSLRSCEERYVMFDLVLVHSDNPSHRWHSAGRLW